MSVRRHVLHDEALVRVTIAPPSPVMPNFVSGRGALPKAMLPTQRHMQDPWLWDTVGAMTGQCLQRLSSIDTPLLEKRASHFGA